MRPRCEATSDEVLGWVGTCLDMTARRAAEEAVVAASERFRIAFDNAPIGMGLVTPDGEWLQVNAAFCRLLGYPEEELLTLNLADLTVPATRRSGSTRPTRRAARRRYLRADGTPLWVCGEHHARPRRAPASRSTTSSRSRTSATASRPSGSCAGSPTTTPSPGS